MKQTPAQVRRESLGLLCLVSVLVTAGCVQLKTEPIRIEPIYIEITVNHKVQKELDDVFRDIDAASETADIAPVDPTGK